MPVEEEIKTIHIKTPVNYICKFCGRRVDPKSVDAGYTIGRGKGKIKQYFHNSCIQKLIYEREINR